MSETITCSVKTALDLLQHLDQDDMITLTLLNRKPCKTFVHSQPRRIKKRKGEELICKAKGIEYQDNDFFGRISLYGVIDERGLIHNLLFPKQE